MVAIRYARAEDAGAIQLCLREAFDRHEDEYTEAAFRDTVLDQDSLRARMAQMAVFVAERDGQVIGTVAAGQVDAGEGHLRGMAVLPACEGAGVGRSLLRRALDELTVA